MSDFEILIRNSDQELPWTTLDEYLQVIVAENDKLTDLLKQIVKATIQCNEHNNKLDIPGVYGQRMFVALSNDIKEWWQSQEDKKC